MRGILLDLDGVLYDSETPVEGGDRVAAWIRARGIPFLYVTNTSSRGRGALVEKLGRFGIPVEPGRILTPCVAAAEWLRAHAGGPAALFVDPRARGEFSGIPILDEAAESGAHHVVVGDMGEGWDFHTLNRAFRLLYSEPACGLMALGMTRFWRAEDGIRLDAAPFVAALEHATGKKARVFGKPSALFFRAAADRLGLPVSEIVMVGDDMATDIAGAQRAGLRGVLVRTGKFRPADLEGEVSPYALFDSIRDLPAWWDALPGQKVERPRHA